VLCKCVNCVEIIAKKPGATALFRDSHYWRNTAIAYKKSKTDRDCVHFLHFYHAKINRNLWADSQERRSDFAKTPSNRRI
jgi:hypothetical protein